MRYRLRTLLIWAAIICVLILPIDYLLSAGPAVWLVKHDYMSPWTYISIYRPLMALAYHNQPFNDAMNWYLSLWGGPIIL